MKIKKTAERPFHLGNRLNGDGNNVRASYGVFDGETQVGFVIFAGGYDAYAMDGKTRLVGFTCRSLAALRTAVEKL